MTKYIVQFPNRIFQWLGNLNENEELGVDFCLKRQDAHRFSDLHNAYEIAGTLAAATNQKYRILRDR
jgi:hypothetical protein